MYPFESLRDSYDELWTRIAGHLDAAPPCLDWSLDPLAAARRPDLALGQTCGWPLVTVLDRAVDVVGAFDMDVPEADEAHYRSVIIEGSDPDAPVAVNGTDSLSGWVSWCAVRGVPDRPLITGAHVDSVFAVAEGRASGASIDAVSWAHVQAIHTDVARRVTVTAHGPRVPTLPLITRPGGDVPAIRRAIDEALRDAPADLLARLRIRSFRPLDVADYRLVLQLVPRHVDPLTIPSTAEGTSVTRLVSADLLDETGHS
jgi:hypothetical protein